MVFKSNSQNESKTFGSSSYHGETFNIIVNAIISLDKNFNFEAKVILLHSNDTIEICGRA